MPIAKRKVSLIVYVVEYVLTLPDLLLLNQPLPPEVLYLQAAIAGYDPQSEVRL